MSYNFRSAQAADSADISSQLLKHIQNKKAPEKTPIDNHKASESNSFISYGCKTASHAQYTDESYEATKQRQSMYFEISSNQYARYRDDHQQSLKLVNRLPQVTFPNTFITNEAICKLQSVFYFEVTIKKCNNARRQIVIGVSAKDSVSNQPLGNERNQYGYRSDGKLIGNKKNLVLKEDSKYGDAMSLKMGTLGFLQGDVVGCGLDLTKQEIFFTVNGVHQGIAFKDVNLGILNKLADNYPFLTDQKTLLQDPSRKSNCKLYPCICLQSQGEEIASNFVGGPSKPFVFDIEAYMQRIRVKEFDQIRAIDTDQVGLYKDMSSLVREYLVHSAFVDTLAAFDQAHKSDTVKLNIEEEKQDQTQEKQARGQLIPVQIQRKMTIDQTDDKNASTKNAGSTSTLERKESCATGEQINQSESDDKSIAVLEMIEATTTLPTKEALDGQDGTAQMVRDASMKVWGTDTWTTQFADDQRPSFISLAANIDDDSKIQRAALPRSQSTFIPASQATVADNASDPLFLEDRNKIKMLLLEGDVEEARAFLKTHQAFGSVYKNVEKVRAVFDALQFINHIKDGNIACALRLSQKKLRQYTEHKTSQPIITERDSLKAPDKNKDETSPQELTPEKVMIPFLHADGKPGQLSVEALIGLISYPDPSRVPASSPLSRVLDRPAQAQVTFDFVNSFIMAKLHDRPGSQLERMFTHLSTVQDITEHCRGKAGRSFNPRFN